MPLLVVEELVGAGGSKSVVSEGSSGQGRVGIRKSESIQRLSRQLSDIKVELQVSLTPSENPSELSSSLNPSPPLSSEIAVPQIWGYVTLQKYLPICGNCNKKLSTSNDGGKQKYYKIYELSCENLMPQYKTSH